jgi:predicted transposase YbfD/YdcC
VAIDGKAMKRAYEKGKQATPKMMVSAWGAEARMTLAARAVHKGNEVAAAIEMLSHLNIKGAIVTGDALHCNRRMAETVIARGADYVLPIKGNQDSLLSDARAEIAKADDPPAAMTKSEEHGRTETRRAVIVEASPPRRASCVSRPQGDRHDRGHTNHRRQDRDGRSLFRVVSPVQAVTAAAHRARPLGDREPPALGSRRGAR